MKKRFISAFAVLFVLFTVFTTSVSAGTKCDTETPAEDGYTVVNIPYDEAYMKWVQSISPSSRYPSKLGDMGILYSNKVRSDKDNWSSSKALFEERGYIPTPYPGESSPTPVQPVDPTPSNPIQPVNPEPTPSEPTPSNPVQPVNPEPSGQRANIEAFVTRFYQTILSRNPDPDGLKYWADGLENGTYSGATLAQGFIMSPEFINKNTDNQTYLNALYRAFFNREPDAGGNTHWLGQLNNGYPRYEVLRGFVNSREFTQLCESYGMPRGTLGENGVNYNAGVRNFVLRCYEKSLRRKGETEGVEYWSDVIITKKMTPLEVASSGFFNSPEFRNKNYSNDEFVEICYETFLGRASEPAGKAYWVSVLNRGDSRESVLHGFAYSREFGEIMSRYGL